MLKNTEKSLLVELICNEQTQMLMRDKNAYNHEKYKNLELIKVKVKDMKQEPECL